MCAACCYGTCTVDPGRQANGCPCHQGKRCKVWDQQAPCLTPYEQVPPSQKALNHTSGGEEQEGQGQQQKAIQTSGGGQQAPLSGPPGQNKVRRAEGQQPHNQVELCGVAGLQRQRIDPHFKDPSSKWHQLAAMDAARQGIHAPRTESSKLTGTQTPASGLGSGSSALSQRPQLGSLAAYYPQFAVDAVATRKVPHLGVRSRPQHPTVAETSQPAPPRRFREHASHTRSWSGANS